MKKKLMTLGLTATMLVLVAQPLEARMNKQRDGKKKGESKAMAALNLTEEQQGQMDKIRLAQEKKMIPLKAELETEKLKMKELRMADNPSKKKMSAQIDRISQAKAKIAKQHLEMDMEVRGILTPEQQKIWAKRPMKQDRKGHKGHRGDKCGPHSGRGRF